MTSLGFVFSMPTTSSEPDMTSQPPEQEYTSESHTTLLSPLLDIDTTKLNVLRNLAIHVQIYSSEHFYKLVSIYTVTENFREDFIFAKLRSFAKTKPSLTLSLTVL